MDSTSSYYWQVAVYFVCGLVGMLTLIFLLKICFNCKRICFYCKRILPSKTRQDTRLTFSSQQPPPVPVEQGFESCSDSPPSYEHCVSGATDFVQLPPDRAYEIFETYPPPPYENCASDLDQPCTMSSSPPPPYVQTPLQTFSVYTQNI